MLIVLEVENSGGSTGWEGYGREGRRKADQSTQDTGVQLDRRNHLGCSTAKAVNYSRQQLVDKFKTVSKENAECPQYKEIT